MSTERRIALAVFASLMLIVTAGGLWIANGVRTARAEIKAFRDAHDESSIVGKTADEIIARYGQPYADARGEDRNFLLIVYKQRNHGQYCSIAFENGVAVRVNFSFQ